MDGEATMTAPTAEGPEDATGRADWASSADLSPSPNMPDVEHSSGAAPEVSAQPQQPQTVPVAVTPLRRPGIMGVMDQVADALAGKTRPELGKDADGNLYKMDTTMTRGQQWRKIAGEAIVGAAAGLKAGRGQGGGAAAAAGVEAGEKLQKQERQNFNDQISDEDKIMMTNANRQMLRMQMAESAWKIARQKVTSSQEDIKFAQDQEDRLVKGGGKVLGTVGNPNEIGSILKINPDLAKDLVQNHTIELIPHTNADGTAGGFKVVKMPDGYRNQFLPAGTVFHTFDSTTGKLVEHHSSEPLTAGEVDDYDTAAGKARMDWLSKKAEQDEKEAQSIKATNDAAESPVRVAHIQAQTREANAQAGEATARAGELDAKAAKERADTGEGPEGEELIDAIGTGHIAMDRLGIIATKNPELLSAVVKKYPDFDTTKVGGYVKMYAKFTSGKAADALDAGSTALRHMQELRALNTWKSHIPGTPDWNRYQNKVDTLAHELARFYGNTTIPAIEGIKSTLASNLPKTRDAAITEQAKSMGDKFDEFESEWNRGVPSAAYRPLMPQLSEASKQARASMDPKYADRLVAEQKAQQTQAPPAPARTIGEPVIEKPLAPARPNAAPAAPQGQAFSKSAWLRANPNGDVNAAVQAAQKQNLPVVD